MILDTINNPNDIKNIPEDQLPELAEEIRSFLIRKISKTGGHLASNLGAVELTMALHLAFTLPEDKLIWDVGHQSYTHKILTRRREGFDNLRRYGGLSGFPKRSESDCDVMSLIPVTVPHRYRQDLGSRGRGICQAARTALCRLSETVHLQGGWYMKP